MLLELVETVEIKKSVKKYWDERSRSYDCSPGHADMPEVWKSLLSRIFSRKGRILDVGTGTGFLAVLLSELGHEVVGIDISIGMLKKARSKSKDVHFKLGDAENLPFADESFDGVVCRHVLWTLPNPEKAVSEWYRVTKPDGKVVIIDSSYQKNTIDRVKSFVGKLGIAVIEKRNPWKTSYAKKLPMRNMSAEKCFSLLKECGFKDVRVHDISWIREIVLRRRSFFYRLAWSSKSYFVFEGLKEV